MNRFTDHDKTMLIGSTNTPGLRRRQAEGHHAPQPVRRRCSQAPARAVRTGRRLQQPLPHPGAEPYEYAWGVGVQSALYVENNYLALAAGVTPDSVVFDWGGTVMTEKGTWVRAVRSSRGK